jgi:hypothetical protein
MEVKWIAISVAVIFTAMIAGTTLSNINKAEAEAEAAKTALENGYIQVPNPEGYKGDTLWVKP